MVEGKVQGFALLQIEVVEVQGFDDLSFSILQSQLGSMVNFIFRVVGDTSFDDDILLCSHLGEVVEGYEERNVVEHLNIVDEDNALCLVLIDEGDVDIFACKFAEVNGVVGPVAFQEVFVLTGCLFLVVDNGTFFIDLVDDVMVQYVVYVIGFPNDDLQIIVRIVQITL